MKGDLRQKVMLFFPHLYHADGRATAIITQEELAKIYNDCLRPTIEALIPQHIAHWPHSYQACLMASKDVRQQFHHSSMDIPADLLAEFAEQLLEKLGSITYFKDAFFVHEWRGTKGSTVHDPEDEDAVQTTLNKATEMLDWDAMEGQDLDEWWIDIGLEVRIEGKVMQWLERAHREVVEYCLPNLNQLGVTKLLGSQKFKTDISALLYDLAGFRAEVHGPGKMDGICYLNVYTTDKSPTYQLHYGAFRRHKAADLLPDKIGHLIKDTDKLGELYDMCAGGGGHAIQEGSARLEVRIQMGGGEVMTKLTDVERELINATMVAIDCVDWW